MHFDEILTQLQNITQHIFPTSEPSLGFTDNFQFGSAELLRYRPRNIGFCSDVTFHHAHCLVNSPEGLTQLTFEVKFVDLLQGRTGHLI